MDEAGDRLADALLAVLIAGGCVDEVDSQIKAAMYHLNGRRDQVIIATKTGGDKATALTHLERSLKRLNTDYIDL